MIRKRLGDALVDAALISREQLGFALGKQRETGMRLGKVLVELKMCTDTQIAEGLAAQLQVPYIDFNKVQIPPRLLQLVPEPIIRKHTLLPVSQEGRHLTVAMADPLDALIIEEIQFQTNLDIVEAIAPESVLQNMIKKYFGSEEISQSIKSLVQDHKPVIEDVGTGKLTFDLSTMDEAASVNFVSHIVRQAILEKASDVHIEPEDDGLRIRYRIDGVLSEIVRVPKANQAEIISRVKIMADMDISEKRLPQDGSIRAKVTDKGVDLRVSTLPCIWGEKIVIRILDKSSLNLSLKDVGFDDDMLKRFEGAVKQPNGILLLNGPTGSGKTSTLYAAINFILSPRINISTVEDPVEMQIKGVNQVHVRSDIGLTFARTLRSLMRQDPNVIMVGEIRDPETAQIAVEAAMTGHLVLSTLHTNDAPSTIGRLIDLQVEPYLVASTLLAAIAQRLVRKICPSCKAPALPTAAQREDLELSRYDIDPATVFSYGRGCINCHSSGYRGRTAVHEMMTMSDKLNKLILSKASSGEIRAVAVTNGMRVLRHNAVLKAVRGITTVDEVLRVTKSEEV